MSKGNRLQKAHRKSLNRQTKKRKRAVAAGADLTSQSGSRLRTPTVSPSRAAPEDEIDFERLRAITLFEQLDGYAPIRNKLRELAHDRRDWAGIPMPLEEARLVIEPTYPRAAEIMKIGAEPPDPEQTGDFRLRNTFWSWRRRCDVAVWEKDGKIEWGPLGTGTQSGMLLKTLWASDAWGIEQEGAAVNTLGSMLRHRQFKQYLITGMFMEQSKRSGVHYLFRKLRPTLAIRATGDKTRILCALCMHPIGYYEGSWSGAMCPTDDVIAHLALMRGDEVMFWRRANQHPSWRPEAGI